MKEADPRAHVERLIEQSNHLGASLYLKEAELDRSEYVELVGVLAGAVVEELSRARRDDRERIHYLRSILAWILRDVPGLGPLYREQLRDARGGGGFLESLTRGIRNAGDVTSGRKSVSEGLQDAAEDVRRNFDNVSESVNSGEAESRLNEFLGSAESNIRQGLDQLGDLFRTMNDRSESDSTDTPTAAGQDAEEEVEDASFEPEDSDE